MSDSIGYNQVTGIFSNRPKWHLVGGYVSLLDAFTLADPFQMHPHDYAGRVSHGQRVIFDTVCDHCQRSLAGLQSCCPFHYPQMSNLQHASVLKGSNHEPF